MKRILKHPNSPIILNSWTIVSRRKDIREQLLIEQDNFCAYTEEWVNPSFAIDIEHFNDSLKDTNQDGYNNWFAASSKLNREKNHRKYRNYSEVLHPTENLNTRLRYDEQLGIYDYDKSDIAVDGLVKILDLNNPILSEDRRNHISYLKTELEKRCNNSVGEFIAWLNSHPINKRYRTAIESVFGVNL